MLKITSIQNDIAQDQMSIQISYEMSKKLFPNLAQMHDLFLIGIMNKQKKPPRNWWFFVGYFMIITNTLHFKNNNQTHITNDSWMLNFL